MEGRKEREPLILWEDQGSLAANRREKSSSKSSRCRYAVVDVDEDDSDNDTDLVESEDRSSYRRRLVEIWPLEMGMLCLEHLQYCGLLLGLSLFWAFPTNYIRSLRSVYWFNLDSWNFHAVSDAGAYQGAKNTNLDSSKVGVDYTWVILAWVLAMIGSAALSIAVWLGFKCVRRHYQLRMAILLSALCWVAIVLALPAITATTRLFRCHTVSFNGTSRLVMDVMNERHCNSSTNVLLIALAAIFVFIPMFLMVPAVLVMWIRTQVVTPCPKKHEAHLKLKEAEFGQGLDDTWVMGAWSLFSAFNRRAVHFHMLSFVWKFLLAAAVSLPHDQRREWKTAQAAICVAVFMLWLVISAFYWRGPYRVMALNVAHYGSVVCLLLVSLLGALAASEVETPLMRPYLLQIYLISLNTTVVAILALVWSYLLVRWWRHRQGRCQSVWPTMINKTPQGEKLLDPNASRYHLAMLRAKQCVLKAQQCPPILAPCHELARHIHIINAYCREAEHESDRLHSSLWHTLDELTATHSVLLRKSIFADTNKDSVHFCAYELHRLLPAWRKQLKKREKDFILVKPVKRRILLKLYVLSIFLSKCAKKHDKPIELDGTSLMDDADGRRSTVSVTVRFADTANDVQSVSSGGVNDYLRHSSRSSVVVLGEDDDTDVHDRFLQAIDDLLPENRARGLSVAGAFAPQSRSYTLRSEASQTGFGGGHVSVIRETSLIEEVEEETDV